MKQASCIKSERSVSIVSGFVHLSMRNVVKVGTI
jgi:hypothetical protein